jgi:NADPH-dependent ferric siderophore reductase
VASLEAPVPDPPMASMPTLRRSRADSEPMSELALEVVGVVDVTPSMRRLTFTSDALADFSYVPGQDLMFTFPADDRTVRRRYTIRSMDSAECTIDVDFVMHGHGPAARWATAARRHDTVTAVGPRGKIGIRPAVDWHLLVGDDSAIPVTLEMLEAVPAATPALAVLEVEDATHEQPAARPISWLHRLGTPLGDPALLLTHLRALELPRGDGAVYLNGERSVMVEARRLLVERGVDPDAISLKSYWVRHEANGDHGEPIPEGGFAAARARRSAGQTESRR